LHESSVYKTFPGSVVLILRNISVYFKRKTFPDRANGILTSRKQFFLVLCDLECFQTNRTLFWICNFK